MTTLTESLTKIKNEAPLVHNITNYVVMNNTANALLAIGASPVMAHALEEVEEIVSIAASLVINIGTLSKPWIAAMLQAAEKAKALQKPFVLDPVGAGASRLRTQTCWQLMDTYTPTVIRGNASEIMALASEAVETKGVDSTHSSERALQAAQQLALKLGNVVVISGAIDYITNGKETIEVHHGSPLMTKVTGMGCTATALIGAFVAVSPEVLTAAAQAMLLMGKAGELTAEKVTGPGSFQAHFLDTLYQAVEATWPNEVEMSYQNA
ncbi:MAG: hydroxyethylthiazole kinase [Thermonemataceae bacterium]